MKRCMGCMKVYADSYQICPHCGYIEGTKVKEASHMMPGSILANRYIVGKVVGHGGFGITYVGWDELLEKRVAIKEYLPSEFSTRIPGYTEVTVFSDEKEEQFYLGNKKFVEEAQKLMKFKSVPGVVQFFNCFKENGTAYIVMEYLEGETLKERLDREKTLPVDEALNIIMPIIESLEEIHKDGIIHRDIAPDNIFFTSDRQVKLIDFGASRYASTTYSKSLSVLVKEGYAPEEQYKGKNQGPWTDVYSLAATFYKMVTGVIPQESLERNIKDKLKLPSKLGVDIPKNIENAIMNALNRKIEDRTQNCTELKKELLDVNVQRNFIKQRKVDIGRWPLWAKIVSGVSAMAIFVITMLLITDVIKFDFTDSISSLLGKNDVEVPEVIARTKEDAEKKISEAGLITQYIDYIENEEIPNDCIYSQSPGVNERVKKGDTVFLVLSCGVETKKMINALGLYADEIKKQLESMGISVQIINEFSNGDRGTVIRQLLADKAIEEDTELKEGMVVSLVVSSGLETELDSSMSTSVPDFKGTTYEQALELAKQNNLYIRVGDEKNSTSVEEGFISFQSIQADATVNAGTVVTLTRSAGDKVVVPNFELKAVNEVENIAENAGVRYKLEYAESDTVAKNHVISQSVERGQEIKYTKHIILTVSKGNSKAEAYTEPKETIEKVTEKETTEQITEKVTEKETTEKITEKVTEKETTEKITEKATEKETMEQIPVAPIGWTEDSSLVNNKYYTYETKKQYFVKKRTVDEETTTSESSTMSGWELCTSMQEWGEYGAWSDWSENVYVASDTRQVEVDEQSYQVITGKQYKYYHWSYVNNGMVWWTYSQSYAQARGGYYEAKYTNTPLDLCQNYDGHMGTSNATSVTNQLGGIWWYESEQDVVETRYKSLYRYRDRDKRLLYLFKRKVYGEWDDGIWTDDKPTESDTCKIFDTKTLYQYIRK